MILHILHTFILRIGTIKLGIKLIVILHEGVVWPPSIAPSYLPEQCIQSYSTLVPARADGLMLQRLQ